MKTNILSVMVDTYSFSETVATLQGFLASETNHIIVTPNPEMIMAAQEDALFMRILNTADLVIPDGIGVVIASKFTKNVITERVPGCDVCAALFEGAAKDKPLSVYLFGGKPGVCEFAKTNIENKYRNVKIIGSHNGYFNETEETLIIDEIKNLKPDVLLVGIGFPKQEKWIFEHKEQLPVKISMGVGGTIDVFAGTVKRAPLAFQKLGLEWFYRLLKQPSRIGRMLILPVFIIKVIFRKSEVK